MTATGTHLLERVQRHTALGLRFWDVAAATTQVDGLRVDVYLAARPYLRRRAILNRSHVYRAAGLPGLAQFEFNDADSERVWSVDVRRYRIEVADPQGRFLPITFDADLPVRGVLKWRAYSPLSLAPCWAGSEAGSPVATMLEGIPLFSAPSRAIPEPLAAVYAQLAWQEGDAPCAWALLEARVGEIRGLGLADGDGRVVVVFPYPPPPRPPLSSPPAPRDDFHWDVELTAFTRAPPSPEATRASSQIPDLADVLEQLHFPQRLLGSLSSPPTELAPQPLKYRTPLTVRTFAAPRSCLYVSRV